ncbi:WD40 repeat-like protein [Phlegmacium glaucopus]|nr:WD40 repeat-like protein [Phlegmacium glaucopus]
MENSFKYVFVQTKPSWFIGSYRSSLSFSSDGTTIAGSLAAMNNPNYSNDQVKFWETATGATTSTFDNWSFVVFSPTDPDMGIIATSTCFRTMKRDSPGGNRWSLQGPGRFAKLFNAGLMPTFRSDGKTFVIRGRDGRFHEYDSTNTTSVLRDIQPSHFMATVVADCPLEPELFILGRENGWLEILSYYTDISKSTLNLHCELTPVGSVRISACAWSQDGKWIATGDDVGDIRLWNAGVTTSISLARLLPRDRSSPITSLIFVPDSTAFIILCGGYLTVWDIARGVYVANSGLPATAMSIALDGPRNRVAVAVDDMIFLYQLKLPQQRLPVHSKLPQQRLPVQKKLPHRSFPTTIARGKRNLLSHRNLQNWISPIKS